MADVRLNPPSANSETTSTGGVALRGSSATSRSMSGGGERTSSSKNLMRSSRRSQWRHSGGCSYSDTASGAERPTSYDDLEQDESAELAVSVESSV
eukprot:786039-Prymnesium_polylepis.2